MKSWRTLYRVLGFAIVAVLAACGEAPSNADIERALNRAIREDAAIHGLANADGRQVRAEDLRVERMIVHNTIKTGDYRRAHLTFDLIVQGQRFPQDAMVSLRQAEDGTWTVFRIDAR